MGWPFAIFVIVLAGVGTMLATMRSIGRTQDERVHDRLSVRFWALLGSLGLLLVFAFTLPIRAQGWLDNDAGMLVVALMSLPPLFVTVVGWRNAGLLALAMRRRRRGRDASGVAAARVIERRRRPFAHDIMEVVLEADVPRAEPSDELTYRQRDPAQTRVHRFVEVCPADHWGRLEPGTTVTLRYDPADLRAFALQLLRPQGEPAVG
ncbi:MAG: hypothetical protein K1X88_16990 [Nannocystaceae bacterium]|nr:hypothetical protein [Nannocystaceae bacterium]